MRLVILFLVSGLLVGACSADQSPQASKPTNEQQLAEQPKAIVAKPAIPREHNVATVTRGATLFAKNCAVCHGARAEGAPQWSRPGPDGKYPPPPLNGTAHTWHHPTDVLVRTIKEGTAKLGGSMPAWGNELADEEIAAIIAWFQSLWPEEIYAAWADLERRYRKAQNRQ